MIIGNRFADVEVAQDQAAVMLKMNN